MTIETINTNLDNETNIDWIDNGEQASASVLNRPLQQVSTIINNNFQFLEQNSLVAGSFGLGEKSIQATNNNVDEVFRSGFYHGFGSAHPNTPTDGDNPYPTFGGAFDLLTIGGSFGLDSYASQIAIKNTTSSPELSFRTIAGVSEGWQPWYSVWHSGNDGPGSGLNADLLDGLNSSSFLRSDTSDTFTGQLEIRNPNVQLKLTDSTYSDNFWMLDHQNGDLAFKYNDSVNAITLTEEGTVKANSNIEVTTNRTTSVGNLPLLKLSNTGTGGSNYANIEFTNGSGDRASIALNSAGQNSYGGNDSLILGGFSQHINLSYVSNNATKVIFDGEGNTTNHYMNLNMHNNSIFGVDQIFHHNDTNTYIQFHAEDQFRVVTGGGERLEINNSQITSSVPIISNNYSESAGFVSSGGTGLYLTAPGGGTYKNTSSTETGYIKISLPQSWTNTMMKFRVSVFDFADNESFDVIISGYNAQSHLSWFSTSATVISDNSVNRNFNVRFGHDGTKCAVYIGESNTTWGYPQIAVTEFHGGYTNFSADQWNSGWEISITTTLGTISTTQTGTELGRYIDNSTVWHAGNDGSGSGLDADLLDGLDSSQFTKYVNNAILNNSADTAAFISELTSKYGCFGDKSVTLKVQWSYTGSSDLNTGHPTIGTIELAGCVIETWGGTQKHIRITRPNTGLGNHGIYEYNDQGPTYSPGWREIWTSESDGAGSGLDADKLDGLDSSSFLRSDTSDTFSRSSGILSFHNTPGDTINTSAGSRPALEVFQQTSGKDAFMTFHVLGDHAAYFGLSGAENDFFVGGWSKGANKYRVYHEGNRSTLGVQTRKVIYKNGAATLTLNKSNMGSNGLLQLYAGGAGSNVSVDTSTFDPGSTITIKINNEGTIFRLKNLDDRIYLPDATFVEPNIEVTVSKACTIELEKPTGSNWLMLQIH